MHWLTDLKNLLYPAQCAGCGRWDQDVCDECWQIAACTPQLDALDDELGVPRWEIWSIGRYGGRLRNMILAAKHEKHGRYEEFLYQCGTTLSQAIGMSFMDTPKPSSVWVVPAPSSWRRQWDRKIVTTVIAQGIVEGLNAQGQNATLRDIARLRLGARSQSSKGLQQRRSGRVGAIYVTVTPPHDVPVILVDDVVTTGATMTQLAKCLEPHVIATAVLARA